MSLLIYLDAGCTQQMLQTQVFSGTGAQTAFSLTNFTGAQLGSVYLESPVSTNGITFASGVGSGFSGLTANALIGQRVIHNGTFCGTVVSNTATTVTVSNLSYSNSTAATAVISSYVKQTASTAYSVSGNTVNMVTAPASGQILHCVPASTLSANFGGTQGSVKTTQTSFWLQRSPLSTVAGASLNTYDNLQVQALDNSQPQTSLTQTGITFASGVGSGFSGLVAGALVGRAVNFGSAFVGTVTANTTTTVTISNTSYNNAVASAATVYTIGSLLFALDSSGAPGTFAPVVQPGAINSDTAVRIWVQDTVTVPNAAMNYPNQIPQVSGIEYLA